MQLFCFISALPLKNRFFVKKCSPSPATNAACHSQLYIKLRAALGRLGSRPVSFGLSRLSRAKLEIKAAEKFL